MMRLKWMLYKNGENWLSLLVVNPQLGAQILQAHTRNLTEIHK